MADIVVLGLGNDTRTEVVVECGMMAGMWTSEIGSSSPNLAEWHITSTILIGNTDTKETLTAFTEKRRLRRFYHTFLSKYGFPLLLTSQIVEESCSQLTEVTAAHLHTADILKVVELLVLLPFSKTECSNSLTGIILSEGVIMLKTESFSKYSAIGSIRPGSHRGTSCLEHHRPIGTRISNALRISLTIANGQEEIHLITGLINQVGNAVPTLTDAKVVVNQTSIRKNIGKQHVVDITDMSQMTIPVEGIGMTALHNGIYWVTW